MTPTTLCENRFALPGSPSTCVLDTVLVPLPSFLLVILLVFAIRSRSPHLTAAKPILPKWLHILYLVLIAATFAMRVLEIVRLVAAKLGVGLLPMGIVSLLFIGGVMWWKGRMRGVTLSAGLMVYWLLMTIFETVKVVRLVQLNNVHPVKGLYPTSDWLLDNAVMLGLYAVFTVYESAHLVLCRKQSSKFEPNFQMRSSEEGLRGAS